MPSGEEGKTSPPRPERSAPDRRTDGDTVQGSGRVAEKGYELVTDDPPPVNQAAPSGDGPPVDLPADAPADD